MPTRAAFQRRAEVMLSFSFGWLEPYQRQEPQTTKAAACATAALLVSPAGTKVTL